MKGFGEWGDRYKQVLYYVRVRGDGEADALAGRIVRCGLGTGGERQTKAILLLPSHC